MRKISAKRNKFIYFFCRDEEVTLNYAICRDGETYAELLVPHAPFPDVVAPIAVVRMFLIKLEYKKMLIFATLISG